LLPNAALFVTEIWGKAEWPQGRENIRASSSGKVALKKRG